MAILASGCESGYVKPELINSNPNRNLRFGCLSKDHELEMTLARLLNKLEPSHAIVSDVSEV